MDKAKQQFLEDHKDDLQKAIWGFELEIRYLERQKLSPAQADLIKIQESISAIKGKTKEFEARIELVDTILSEGNN